MLGLIPVETNRAQFELFSNNNHLVLFYNVKRCHTAL
jgi:hypothetical protein